MRIVIIGGVAGGMSAATRLRRLDEETEIIVLEKGPYVSFANCGLPYHISKEIENREDLLLQSPEQLRIRFNIDVRVNQEVTKIHPQNKSIVVKREDSDYTLTYDTLILSPGAKPVIPPIKGIEKATNLFTLRNVSDMDNIMQYINDNNVKNVVVIGGGFIGVEVVENVSKIGLSVTLLEAKQQILPTVDKEMARFAEKEMHRQGITVLTTTSAVEFNNKGKEITLSNGEILVSDMTIVSIGVMPENTLAQDADLEIGMQGGIMVNEKYQTSDANIYAIGDAILVKQHSTKEDALISLASPANRQGRQVADTIMKKKRKNAGSLGTSIVRVFDIAIASTGLTQRQLQEKEWDYKEVHIVANSHAGYFPGAESMTLKVLFHPTTSAIYGAQAVGKDGVDKRIDILATAIKANLTVADLPELEFTYAPPFGSAKDPVNMIGYVALNIIEGVSENIQYYELDEYIKKGAYIIDVRTKQEIAHLGELPTAVNIPVDELRERMKEIPKDKQIIVSCQSGLRSYIAERILKNKGYKVKNLDGAYHIYSTMNPIKEV